MSALPPRPPYWLCSPRTPTCRKRHAYVSFRENQRGSIIDFRGVSGWLLYTCGTCGGHAFGVQDAANEVLHMYEVSLEQLTILQGMPRSTKVWILLEFLGYMESRDAETERAIATLDDDEAAAALAKPR